MAHLSPAAMMIAVAALQQKTPTDGAGFTGHDGPAGASHRPPPLSNSRSGFGTHESCRDLGSNRSGGAGIFCLPTVAAPSVWCVMSQFRASTRPTMWLQPWYFSCMASSAEKMLLWWLREGAQGGEMKALLRATANSIMMC